MTQSLDLFTCEPYTVRLLPKMCGRRFKLARSTGKFTVAGMGVTKCRGCPVGKLHSKGQSAAEVSPVVALVSADMIRQGRGVTDPIPTRTCKCGDTFEPPTRNTVYCGPKCPSKPKRAAPKRMGIHEKFCKTCGVGFMVNGSEGSRRKYCDDHTVRRR